MIRTFGGEPSKRDELSFDYGMKRPNERIVMVEDDWRFDPDLRARLAARMMPVIPWPNI